MNRNLSHEAVQSRDGGFGNALGFLFKLGAIAVLIWLIANMSDKPFMR